MSVTDCLSSANDLLAAHASLVSRVRTSQRYHRRQLAALPSPPQSLLKLDLLPSPPPSPSLSPPGSPVLQQKQKILRTDLPPAKKARVAKYQNYVPEEETIRNDYSQRYVDGGEWPQNWVLGADPARRFEEYPKQQRLLGLKKASVNAHAHPPTYLPISQLSSLQQVKFDVILIDPPFSSSFSWADLQDLPIPALSADPSFVLLWVGSGAGDGLERGREVLARWGFRRCEDIVWVKTNSMSNDGPGTDPPTTSLLARTKQHCLMGIRGTVRRSTDSWFVHCNVDTDVVIWEGDPDDPTLKPPEMYTLVENFCLGLRRLELFARGKTLRRGWVSALAEGEEERVQDIVEDDSEGITQARVWDKDVWERELKELAKGSGGRMVVPMTPEIDALRPKSPVRGGPSNVSTNSTPNPPAQPRQGHLQHQRPGPGGHLTPDLVQQVINQHTMAAMGGGGPGGLSSMPTMQNMPGVVAMSNVSGMGGMPGMNGMGGIGGPPFGSGMMVPGMNQMGHLGPIGGMGQMGSMGGMGQMGNMGQMGGMGGMMGMDPMGMNLPGMGGMGGPGGQLHGHGGLPNLPNVTNLQNLPGMPGMQGMQGMGGMPGMPGMMGGPMSMNMGGVHGMGVLPGMMNGMEGMMGMNHGMGNMGNLGGQNGMGGQWGAPGPFGFQ